MNEEAPQDEPLLSVRQAAQQAGYAYRVLLRKIKKGEVVAIRMGGTIRVALSNLPKKWSRKK